MKPRSAALSALVLLAASAAAQGQPARYQIDDDHTYATFAIDHFGASVNRARFDDVTGTVQFDKAARTGKIDVSVAVASLYSGSKAFDKHLVSADLFDAARHPSLRFVSDQLVFQGDKLVEVPGQLTLLGKTHPVTLKANQFACYPNPMAKTEACGGDFEAVIDRTLWGMNFATDFGMPKQVKITATIEAFKR